MAKGSKPKSVRRQDKVAESLPRLFQGTRHSAYTWLRKCKEGQLPPGNTHVRKALDAIEIEILRYFGRLNALQQVQLSLMRPLITFWILHPAKGENGNLTHDFKWVHSKLEAGLRALKDLADTPSNNKPPTLEDIAKTVEK
ncbi:MAG: hypothetical protein JRJ66_12580 [Deltaproteobacteria bacterium]|nr:hypothetical protein [Deltaproteobacteria bacterium]MBW2046037.1 hypothetical protein [Deltaproteobacteria bacterium]